MFELKEAAYYASIALPILVFLGYLANKFYFSGGVCKSKNRLDGKVVIITGANTGIGYETALELVKRGARVILACRDLKKAEAAADKIRLETDSKNVFVEQLDLSSFESIRDFTRRFKANFTRLDILINNAGLFSKKRAETKDGFELHFGVMYLGHYLLTGLLINYLKDSAPSRIINLSGSGNFGVEMKFDDLQSEKDYSCIKADWRAQLANRLFSIELAKRFGDKGITSVTLCPGSVRTEITREVKSEKDWIWLLYNVVKPLYLVISKSPKEGAQTTIHCAVDDDIPNNNGKFFRNCKVVNSSHQSADENAAKKLWEISEKLTGFSY